MEIKQASALIGCGISGHFLCGFSGWDKWKKLTQGLEQNGFLIITVKPKTIWPNAATHLTTEILNIVLEFIIEQPSLLSRAALHNHSLM